METEIKMELGKSNILEIIQKYLENPPVVIWGSGATIPYGMPSMSALNTEIGDKIESFDGTKNNLEEELGEEKYKKYLPEIRKIIWNKINDADKNIIPDLLHDQSKYAGIFKMVNKCIEAHPKVMNIITTNYDRIIENVLSYHKISFTDGFVGRILSVFNENLFSEKNIVNVIKVHGSLNWGKYNDEIRYIDCNYEIEPLIIPPGKNKYQETYHTPYRELIQYSDKIIKSADSFFVIGFGFNDEHITPEIKNKINKGTPLVLITKKVTETTKAELSKAQKYVLLEECETGKTSITIKKDKQTTTTILEGQYWQLNKFMGEIW